MTATCESGAGLTPVLTLPVVAGALLLVLSADDYTAKEFLEFVSVDAAWQGSLARQGLTRRDITDADHTFSDPPSRRCAEAVLLNWLRDSWGDAR